MELVDLNIFFSPLGLDLQLGFALRLLALVIDRPSMGISVKIYVKRTVAGFVFLHLLARELQCLVHPAFIVLRITVLHILIPSPFKTVESDLRQAVFSLIETASPETFPSLRVARSIFRNFLHNVIALRSSLLGVDVYSL